MRDYQTKEELDLILERSVARALGYWPPGSADEAGVPLATLDCEPVFTSEDDCA